MVSDSELVRDMTAITAPESPWARPPKRWGNNKEDKVKAVVHKANAAKAKEAEARAGASAPHQEVSPETVHTARKIVGGKAPRKSVASGSSRGWTGGTRKRRGKN